MENSQENCQSSYNQQKTPVKSAPLEQEPITEISLDPNYRSPRFEFDAPRYINFSSKRYRETRRLLNKIVLHKEESSDDSSGRNSNSDLEESDTGAVDGSSSEEELELFKLGMTEEFNLLMRIETDSGPQGKFNDFDDCDPDWFTRFHPLHEPLRPMTPPGPLISPERSNRTSTFRPEAMLESIEKRGSSPSYRRSNTLSISLTSSPTRTIQRINNNSTNFINLSPTSLRSKHHFSQPPTSPLKQQHKFGLTASINTPSKGPNTRIGLRAKPVRVLKNSEPANTSKSPLKGKDFDQRSDSLLSDDVDDSYKLSISSLTRNNDSFHERYSRQSGPLSQNQGNLPANPLSSPLKSPIKRTLLTNTTATTTTTTNNNNNNGISNVNGVKTSISSPLRNSVKVLPLDHESWTNFSAGSGMKVLSPINLPTKRSLRDSDSDLVGNSRTSSTSVIKKACLLPQQPQQHQQRLTKPKLSTTTQHSPTINSQSNFTPSPITNRPTPILRPSRKKAEDVDLNDIKKLLNQHNSRLKPNNKKT